MAKQKELTVSDMLSCIKSNDKDLEGCSALIELMDDTDLSCHLDEDMIKKYDELKDELYSVWTRIQQKSIEMAKEIYRADGKFEREYAEAKRKKNKQS